ncbi:MAG: M1 family metallopeptidase [Lewinellaceae bacterium]|nr:M1 family metallopeptidase [Saprospiraceae bacterium]MCB9337255.1 M1 family metallopeptidase [Lewinellaceae bacterium]
MNFLKSTLLLPLFLLPFACRQTEEAKTPDLKADPHSFAQPNEAVTKHLDLHLAVDFDQKKLSGYAKWTIENKGADEIIFDTRNLDIQKVTIGKDERVTEYFLVDPDELLGTALRVKIEPETDMVTIYYATKPGAAALGWMEPSQTAGKKLPFLFTQGQAILTRTWIPCQDSPGIRITYDATIQTPIGMLALMSAENPQEKTADGIYHFRMEQPIPPYLIALAVGDIAFKAVGPRTGVYAEPPLLEKTAWEFADMEKMVESAESLYGPYAWGRYDLIVLPPGFPFGGMENPRLTFATPTVIAGDRSLVSLVAHELAHSWSGNLVTNATWNDFWLNEGFTVYFERRIMEKLYGKEYVDMLAALEYQELLDEIKDINAGKHPEDTQLKLDLAGRDPDEAGTDIAYQKGAFFLQYIEEKSGRERFDAFLKQYFEEHKFQVMTTEEFLAYLKKNLLDKYKIDVNVDEWVYQPDLPADFPIPHSDRFAKVEAAAKKVADTLPDTTGWTSHEWVHFIRQLPENVDVATLKKLDEKYNLTQSGNSEILFAWYETAIRRGYSGQILPSIENFLVNVGRRRFLMPIYRAFKETGQLETARKIFEKAKSGYHAVSYGSVEQLLNNGE